MSKPAVTYPDPERAVVDLLDDELATAWAGDVTVGVALPADWTPASDPHVMVAWDGTPTGVHPISANATVRLVAYAASPTAAKELAGIAQGVLLAVTGHDVIRAPRFLTGVQPAVDPASGADIAATTTRVAVRSEPI